MNLRNPSLARTALAITFTAGVSTLLAIGFQSVAVGCTVFAVGGFYIAFLMRTRRGSGYVVNNISFALARPVALTKHKRDSMEIDSADLRGRRDARVARATVAFMLAMIAFVLITLVATGLVMDGAV